jgi:hypothetical protein
MLSSPNSFHYLLLHFYSYLFFPFSFLSFLHLHLMNHSLLLNSCEFSWSLAYWLLSAIHFVTLPHCFPLHTSLQFCTRLILHFHLHHPLQHHIHSIHSKSAESLHFHHLWPSSFYASSSSSLNPPQLLLHSIPCLFWQCYLVAGVAAKFIWLHLP